MKMKKIIILALALLSMAQVWAKEPVTRFREKLFDNKSKYVTVVAHRGDWRNSPENSMQAFRNCLEMGVDMIEIDVRKTKDNELVIIHDATVDRTTNGKGKVALCCFFTNTRQFRKLINKPCDWFNLVDIH